MLCVVTFEKQLILELTAFFLLEDYIIEHEKRNHAEERFPKDLDIALS